MRSRLLELIGPEFMQVSESDRPRAVEPMRSSSSEFYINPDVEFAFPYPEFELISPKGPTTGVTAAKGHRPIAGGATEILESPNARPARPPRRCFRVDVTESGEEYILRADLAGMSKENVKIDVLDDQNIVSITVEPPKNEFFGMYKSALESMETIEISEEKEHREPKEEEKQPEHKMMPEKEICHLIERCTGPMSRAIKMPNAVDMSSVNASIKEGLLMIKFAKKKPVSQEFKKKSIEIN
jgi:HSP20 family molecular chaperone IbpA